MYFSSPLPGAIPTKPGSATVPFFGIRPVILDPHSGKEINEPNVTGVLAVSQPWPSMTRTVYNNHNRFMDTYLKPYPGYYFTGDGAFRDSDGYIWIQGINTYHYNIYKNGHLTIKKKAEWMMLSMYQATDSQQQKLKLL